VDRSVYSGHKCLFDNMLIILVLFDIILGGQCLIMLMLMLRNILIMMIMLRNYLILMMLRNCLIMVGGHCLFMLA
jgi:hypothetical protein